MTYAEAMQFWFGRINYEHRSPRFGDFKLDCMRALLRLLGNPHERLRIVHVAGSKGKGSTAALIASILRQEGYRTGLFTSPHLVHVEERFQVDGTNISAAELTALLEEVREASLVRPALERELTFFEVATAVGLLHFVRRRVDVAVLEVGLGGRFDSTNVCRPMVAVITSISYDHTQMLGNSLASIAREKAGIIKPGRPTVSGVRGDEAQTVIRATCRQRGSPLVELDTGFHYEDTPALVRQYEERPARVQITTRRRSWPAQELGLIGAHQAANAALAVAVIEELSQQGVAASDRAVAAGLAHVRWPARLEVLGRRPLVLLDCAHNVASAQALAEALLTSFPLLTGGRARRLLLFAGSRDKDLAGMLAVLAPLFARLYLTRFQSNPRSVPPEQLTTLLPAEQQANAVPCATTAEAWQRIRQDATEDDLICATGSVFLAGELRALLCPDDFDKEAASLETE
jgi:dihydrofolate synthase/folylpolyglutamate synthase